MPSFLAAATVSSQSFCQLALCACAKPVDANNNNAEILPSRIMVPCSSSCRAVSVPDVLQEKAGRNLMAQPPALDLFIDLAGDGVELRSLQITAFRIGDLVGRGAAFCLPAEQVGKRDPLVGECNAVRTAFDAAVPKLGRARACLIADMLGVGGELRMADRGRAVAEAQINIDALECLLVRLAAATDHDDMRAFFQQASVGYRDGGVGQRRHNMRALVNILRLVADLDFDVVAVAHLVCEFFPVCLGGA